MGQVTSLILLLVAAVSAADKQFQYPVNCAKPNTTQSGTGGKFIFFIWCQFKLYGTLKILKVVIITAKNAENTTIFPKLYRRLFHAVFHNLEPQMQGC